MLEAMEFFVPQRLGHRVTLVVGGVYLPDGDHSLGANLRLLMSLSAMNFGLDVKIPMLMFGDDSSRIGTTVNLTTSIVVILLFLLL